MTTKPKKILGKSIMSSDADGHRPQSCDRKLAVDHHGEVPGGSAVRGGAVSAMAQLPQGKAFARKEKASDSKAHNLVV